MNTLRCKKEQKKKRDMSLKGHRLREKNNEKIALSNPMEWWKDSENESACYGVQLPTLGRLVRHLYCVVATSVPSELKGETDYFQRELTILYS